MLDFKRIDNLSADEKKGLVSHILDFNPDANVKEILGYVACNDVGYSHGPTLGNTWKNMEDSTQKKFDKNISYFGIHRHSDSQKIPEIIKNKRMKAVGFYNKAPFDFIVYKEAVSQ